MKKITNENVRERLITFLVKHGAYAAFCRGLKRENQDNRKPELFDVYVLHYTKSRSGLNIVLTGAFNFSQTKEGLEYWYKLHCKWLKELY